MSQSTGHIVVSLWEYRLAPEYRFPTALMDCYAAAKALYTNKLILNTDPRKITIMGDSAGGNLLQQQLLLWQGTMENSRYIVRFLFIRPYIIRIQLLRPMPRCRRTVQTICLLQVKMQDYLNLYESCPGGSGQPLFCALFWQKDFSNMPETPILTAEFDPLRDEGEDYGKKTGRGW